MRIGDYDIPDKCPLGCSFKEEIPMQGGWCHRCPIFNCTGEYPMMRPEEYRKDWAGEWAEFFDGGPEPTLRFTITRRE